VVARVQAAVAKGTSYGAPTEGEVVLAELLAELVPSMEMSRLTSSGTEAVMGALRVARGFTGRDIVVKCAGCYHGGADYLLVKAGSGAATFGVPDSAGVPAAIAQTTALVPFNDLDAVRAVLEARDGEVAAVIVEPVAGNMGCVPPADGYLAGLRELTAKHGALLVFDEVMTGFRVALGGAQARYGVTPDLTCLGKIVGGGLPVGAYGGRREIMERIAPLGPVYQAGTLSGNPLAVAAGLATLERLRSAEVYERLERAGASLASAFEEEAARAKVPITVQRVGSMLTPFFREGPVRSWDDAAACDTEAFGRWHRGMREEGVYWPPSQFEAGFVSLAHDGPILERTRVAARAAFSRSTR
jgi:glutamate-1-semialdehyde 2,1-aminomutase